MGLIVSPSQWAYCYEGVDSTPAYGSFGVDFTAGASDVMGTAVEVLSALAQDVHYLELTLAADSASGNVKRCLVDLLIDPAGGSSWSTLAAGLIVGPWNTLDPVSSIYRFPLWCPAGASLGVRGATVSSGTASCHCAVRAMGGPSKPDAWWCGQGVESLGYNYTGTTGTGVTAASGSFGSWTSIGGTTTYRYGALQVGTGGPDSSAAYNTRGYWAQVGIGDTALPVGRIGYMTHTIEMLNGRRMQIPPHIDIPSGSQLQMQVQAEAGTESLLHTLYGVY